MKTKIKNILPQLLVDFIKVKKKARFIKKESTKAIFTTYKESKYWKSEESLSGDGSEIAVTKHLRIGLENLIRDYDVKSMLDIPCGDFNWMKVVNLGDVEYVGADIVESLVVSNTTLYASKAITFKELDIVTDKLPQVDLIFCRDCLVHLSYSQIYRALIHIKRSKSKYLLATSFVETYLNRDILTGEWRKLNLEASPFNFKKPLTIIDENYTLKGLKYSDKSMCLWYIEDIKIPLKLKLYSLFFKN